MSPLPGLALEEGSRATPRYDLRAKLHGPDDLEIEVWQVPSPATPHLRAPLRVAGLRGRNLALVEHRVLRRLTKEGVQLGGLPLNDLRRFRIDEDLALTLGLLGPGAYEGNGIGKSLKVLAALPPGLKRLG